LPTEPFCFVRSSGGWNRTSGLHVQSVALLPAVTAPESSSRITSIREEGFEPSPSDSKSGGLPVSRFPSGRRGSRTLKAHRSPDFESGAVTHRLALPSSLLRSSAQRESNPRFRHGKAVGYHYNMGTCDRSRIVNESGSTGWDSNPRRRITGAESSPLDDQCKNRTGTRGARTLTHLVKSQALCH
jgi:hypothetical protein